MPVVLRGMTWEHPRGVLSLSSATTEFTASHPDVEIRWSARSLAEFENVPVREMVSGFDLLAIDHPFVGQADREGLLVALDQVLPTEVIADRAINSVGPSHASYQWGGHQLALAVDAAAQVSAYRADLLGTCRFDPPRTWVEATELIKSLRGEYVAVLPASPTHMFACLLSLCCANAHGESQADDLRPLWWSDSGLLEDVAIPAVEQLHELLTNVAPESIRLDPIQALDRVATEDRIAYIPLVFGYVNYAREGYGPRRVSFRDVPTNGDRPTGALLGGVGIAVSAYSNHRELATEFAAWVTGEQCQKGSYFSGGGQPGHRSAWTDAALDKTVNGFFSSTLSTIDRACVRPRGPHYPGYQRRAGHLLHDLTVHGLPAKQIVAQLNTLWREVTRGSRIEEYE